MSANRRQSGDEADRKSLPEGDTGVPTPKPGELERVKLDLRSNAENDWQDEMPEEPAEGGPKRSSHKPADADESEQAHDDEEPNGSFGDGDSARAGRG